MSQFSSPMMRHMTGRRRPIPEGTMPTPKTIPTSSIFSAMRRRAQPGGATAAPTMPRTAADVLNEAIGTEMVPSLPKKGDARSLFMSAFDQANQANDTRYRQALGLMEGQGTSSKFDAKRQSEEGFAGDTQSLISRGLGSSTVFDSARRRRDEDYQRAAQSIDESVADRAAGIIERRTDQAPNINTLLELEQQKAIADAEAKAQKKGVTRSIYSPDRPGFGEGGGGMGGLQAQQEEQMQRKGGGGGGKQGVRTYRNTSGSFFNFATGSKSSRSLPQAPVAMKNRVIRMGKK